MIYDKARTDLQKKVYLDKSQHIQRPKRIVESKKKLYHAKEDELSWSWTVALLTTDSLKNSTGSHAR